MREIKVNQPTTLACDKLGANKDKAILPHCRTCSSLLMSQREWPVVSYIHVIIKPFTISSISNKSWQISYAWSIFWTTHPAQSVARMTSPSNVASNATSCPMQPTMKPTAAKKSALGKLTNPLYESSLLNNFNGTRRALSQNLANRWITLKTNVSSSSSGLCKNRQLRSSFRWAYFINNWERQQEEDANLSTMNHTQNGRRTLKPRWEYCTKIKISELCLAQTDINCRLDMARS